MSDAHASTEQHLKLFGKRRRGHDERGRHGGGRHGERGMRRLGAVAASTGSFGGHDGDVIAACRALARLPQRTDDLRNLEAEQEIRTCDYRNQTLTLSDV